MTDSFTTELRDIIDRTFTDELGGTATASMLQTHVWGALPEHLTDFLVHKGLRDQVRAYFREKDHDGLPLRPAANPEGEHKQLELFSVEEFAYLHADYQKRAAANEQQAEKVRARCLHEHGVDLAAISAAS